MEYLKIKPSYQLILLFTALLHLYLWLILLPYAQKTANSHINSGPFWAKSLSFIGTIWTIIAIGRFIQKRDGLELILALITVGSLSFWIYKLSHLMCQACLNSG